MIEFSEKLFSTLMQNNATPKEVAAKLALYVRIQQDLLLCRTDLAKEIDRHKQAIEIINSRIIHIRKMCDHPDTTYSSDPSGGSDSSNECNICGKEVRRL